MRVIELRPFLVKRALALLDEPKTGDIFQQAIGSIHATFIGEIEL